MSRFKLLGVALFVVFAFGVLTASASAVTFLLAEWLVNGAAVTTELLAEVTGEMLLEDTKAPIVGKVTILCSGLGVGWVGPNSLGWGSEILTLSGGAVSTTPLVVSGLTCAAQTGCEANPAPVIWPVNLGYEGEVELMEDGGSTFFALLGLPHAGGGNPGWEIECTMVGVKIVDECTVAESVAELTLEGTTLLAVDSEAFNELAGIKLGTCSLSGTESAVLEGEGPVVLNGGGELTASSEGVSS